MSKILLVEDDNNLREIYEARLQAEGYVIASAKDGEEALVVAKAEKPDLIISDVMMPKISGFEMLDILRNTPELKDTKVVMLTALGQAEDQNRASHLGADRYLVKSQVTLEDIVKAAHDLLGDGQTAETEEQSPAMPEITVTETASAPVPAPSEEVAAMPAPDATVPEMPAPVVAETQPVMPEPLAETAQVVPEPVMQTPAAMPAPANTTFDQTTTPPLDTNQAANVETLTRAVEDLASNDIAPTTSDTAMPTATAQDSETNDDSSSISGKKVIKPLDVPPQKSLDELLAIEEASQPVASVPAEEPVVMEPRNQFDPDDPNNIAL